LSFPLLSAFAVISFWKQPLAGDGSPLCTALSKNRLFLIPVFFASTAFKKPWHIISTNALQKPLQRVSGDSAAIPVVTCLLPFPSARKQGFHPSVGRATAKREKGVCYVTRSVTVG